MQIFQHSFSCSRVGVPLTAWWWCLRFLKVDRQISKWKLKRNCKMMDFTFNLHIKRAREQKLKSTFWQLLIMFLLPNQPVLKAIRYWHHSGIVFAVGVGRQNESFSSIDKALSYLLRLSAGVRTRLRSVSFVLSISPDYLSQFLLFFCLSLSVFSSLPNLKLLDGIPKLPEDSSAPGPRFCFRLCTIL